MPGLCLNVTGMLMVGEIRQLFQQTSNQHQNKHCGVGWRIETFGYVRMGRELPKSPALPLVPSLSASCGASAEPLPVE
jgi:hypothetical protein